MSDRSEAIERAARKLIRETEHHSPGVWIRPMLAEIRAALALPAGPDLAAKLRHIVQCHEMAAELYTTDKDHAGNLADHARAALEGTK